MKSKDTELISKIKSKGFDVNPRELYLFMLFLLSNGAYNEYIHDVMDYRYNLDGRDFHAKNDLIFNSFYWAATNEGHDFWHLQHNAWSNLLDRILTIMHQKQNWHPTLLKVNQVCGLN